MESSSARTMAESGRRTAGASESERPWLRGARAGRTVPRMSLQKQLQEDLKAAMKAKDVVARDVLRMLKKDLTDAELQKGAALDEDEELQVLIRAVKSRKDSATQYDEGGRKDLADTERAEVAIIEGYLPQPLTEDEAREAIEALAKKLGVSEKKQMGQLMSAVMDEYRGRIDGKLASKIAGGLLS